MARVRVLEDCVGVPTEENVHEWQPMDTSPAWKQPELTGYGLRVYKAAEACEMSERTRRALAVLAHACDDDHFARISYPQLADAILGSDLAARSALKRLTRLGWVSLARQGGGRAPHTYALHIPDAFAPGDPPAA